MNDTKENFGIKIDLSLSGSDKIVKMQTARCEDLDLYGLYLSDLNKEILSKLSEMKKLDVVSLYNGGSAGGVYLLYGYSSKQFKVYFKGPLRGVNKLMSNKNCPDIEVSVHPVSGGITILKFKDGKYKLEYSAN